MNSVSQHFVKESTFAEILPLWARQLWPDRISKIEPTSAIDSSGAISLSLLNEKSYFWKIEVGHKIIGVIGAQDTHLNEFRSRGLWVDSEYRKFGIGTLLLNTVVDKAQKMNKSTIWSMPRASSIGFYQKLGFQIKSEIQGYEYGPHFIAVKKLDPS